MTTTASESGTKTRCEACGTSIPGRLYPRLCPRCWDLEQDRRHEHDDAADRDDFAADESLNLAREEV